MFKYSEIQGSSLKKGSNRRRLNLLTSSLSKKDLFLKLILRTDYFLSAGIYSLYLLLLEQMESVDSFDNIRQVGNNYLQIDEIKANFK